MTFPLLLQQYELENDKVNLYVPDRNAIMDAYQQGLISFPYWSQVWPASIALSRFLIHHLHYIQGKKVLELAAGLGLPSVIAARKAAFVIASDYQPEAVRAMQETVKCNHLQNMQVQLLDWYALPDKLVTDVLLLSDVSYDTALFDIQEKWIRKLLQQGSTVIISTPQRLVARDAILPLLSFCDHQVELLVEHNEAVVPVTVMVLC